MSRHHPPYASEFRRQIIEMARAGRTPVELSREFGIAAQTARNWIRQADLDEGRRDDGVTTQESEEVRRLRREVRQLREEREILKNALRPGDGLPGEKKLALGYASGSRGERPARFLVDDPGKKRGPGMVADRSLVRPSGEPV